jgi:uncharacterized protein
MAFYGKGSAGATESRARPSAARIVKEYEEKPMKRIAWIPVAAALIAQTAVAQSTASPPPREAALLETISVTGTGKSTVIPDRFSFTVGVQTQALSVDDAVNQNNEKIAAVISALKKAGAADTEVRTSSFYIMPMQDYQQGRPPRITGYQVTNSVTVTKDNPSVVGRLLQVAVGAGVNQASGIQFSVSDPAKGRDQGLQRAFADARSKATVLAQAAGRSIGRALTISEGSAPVPPRPMFAAGMVAKAEAVSAVPVEEGSQENSYTVSVVFELR